MPQSQHQTLPPNPPPPTVDGSMVLAVRPSQYPLSVLWLLDDCKTDPSISLSTGNASRPPMGSVIRHQDGSRITKGEYQIIKTSAQHVAAELLQLPVPSQHSTTRRTITYFKDHHPEELAKAIAKLEDAQPLLALCATHWKASHMVANSLTAAVSVSTNTQKANGSQVSRETGRKRLLSSAEPIPLAPKKARTDAVGPTNLNHAADVDTELTPPPASAVTTTNSSDSAILPQNNGPAMKRGLPSTVFTTDSDSLPANRQDPADSSGSSGSPASSPGHDNNSELVGTFESHTINPSGDPNSFLSRNDQKGTSVANCCGGASCCSCGNPYFYKYSSI